MSTLETPPRRTAKAPRPRPGSEPIGLLEAAKTYPSRVIIPIVVLIALALVVAFARPTTYKAQAKLAVGRIDVSTVAAPGVVSASQSLASAYSRAIGADEVHERIEAKLGKNGVVTASPIPESPVILVEAEGETEEEAINVANVGSQALIAYINKLNSNAAESERLLETYQKGRLEVVKLESQLNRETAGTETAAVAEAELSVAQLKVKASEAAYRTSLEEETNGNDVRVLTTAQEATNDRKSVLKILLFAAVIAGAGLGLLWAYLEAVRRSPARRSRPAASA